MSSHILRPRSLSYGRLVRVGFLCLLVVLLQSCGDPNVDFDRDTVWRDVFDTLTVSQQSCIRNAAGAELDWMLQRQILDEDEMSQQELASLPCLPSRLVRAVFLAAIIVGWENQGMEVDDEQEACLQEVVDEIDVGALLSVLASESSASDAAQSAAQLFEMMAGLLRCLPEWFEAVDGVDDYGDGVEGAAGVVLGESVEGVLNYDGDVDYFVFEAVKGDLYEIEVDLGTLAASWVTVSDEHEWKWGYSDDRGYGSLGSGLSWMAPESGDFYVEVAGQGEGSYTLMVRVTDIVDDYSDQVDGAAGAVVDESVEGVLDYWWDVDYFVFEAVEGELYEIEVDLGTLAASWVVVYDDAGWELGSHEDRGDSGGSRLRLKAPVSGDFYVEVAGWGEGSYTLMVRVTDIVDDYSDQVDGAAGVRLGESVEGVLDYRGDVDYFVFEAVEGELYEINVDLGTLSDSWVAVHDADGTQLGYDDERTVTRRGDGSRGSRLSWRAPRSGYFYVAVSGPTNNYEGSYTLRVAVSE